MKINSSGVTRSPYLQVLEHIAHPPHTVYYTGHLPPRRTPSVAIVGTRKPTPYGKEVTFKLAYELAQKGVVVISGLAFGIDAIAHRAALDAGGITIAILPGGIENVYPASHRRLAMEIVEKGGALISEYPGDTGVQKFQLLARNRLVSGLADAVVVTEAAARSGTLSTVNHALDQNKEIFAVPGNITSLLSIGPNRLIQQGAHPVTSTTDILDILMPNRTVLQTPLFPNETAFEKQIIEAITSGMTHVDQLSQVLAATASDLSAAITMLELNGRIRATGANNWMVI